jgi:hypothetical protein
MSETHTPDRLIGGDFDIVTKHVTVLSGEGVLGRGTVLGKIITGAGSIAATAGNTGDGVAGAITVGAKAKVGAYKLTCIAAAANAGRFQVVDPDGIRMADLTIAVAYTNGHFAITIADGANDFVVGDSFTLTVAAGSGKYRACNKANTDGSHIAECVLSEAIDATAADVVNAPVYDVGQFNSAALVFGGASVVADHAEQLRARSIFLAASSAQ